MIIIYGGIQPDGLVLAVHKFTIDTSKKNRSIVDPRLTTRMPIIPSTVPPMRGTVGPVSKWGPYDKNRPWTKWEHEMSKERATKIAAEPEIDLTLHHWARRTFNFDAFRRPNSVNTLDVTKEVTAQTNEWQFEQKSTDSASLKTTMFTTSPAIQLEQTTSSLFGAERTRVHENESSSSAIRLPNFKNSKIEGNPQEFLFNVEADDYQQNFLSTENPQAPLEQPAQTPSNYFKVLLAPSPESPEMREPVDKTNVENRITPATFTPIPSKHAQIAASANETLSLEQLLFNALDKLAKSYNHTENMV